MKAVSIHFLLLASLILATGACRKRTDVPTSGDETASTQQDALSGSDTTTAVGEGPVHTPGSRAAIAESLGTANAAYEAWFKKHRLDLNDPAMLDADPDGDGATNRDEFTADTNPRDPNSRPGVHAFIRLQEYREVKVPLMLEAIEGETARIKHLGDGESRTETVRAGQTIHGMKVARMLVRKETDKNGDPVDLSRVELDDPSTKEHVLLVKDMPAKSPASHAILTSADRQTTVTVRQGEVFEWPGNPAARYKVVDLREDQAVVQEVATKKMFTIPRQ